MIAVISGKLESFGFYCRLFIVSIVCSLFVARASGPLASSGRSHEGECGTNLSLIRPDSQALLSLYKTQDNSEASHPSSSWLDDGIDNGRQEPQELSPESRAKRLADEGVLIRLEVIVDRTFSGHMNNNQLRIFQFIKSLIYETQLFFERPEMKTKIKFTFVLIDIRESKSNYPSDIAVDELLRQFAVGGDVERQQRRADLSILLVHRALWLLRDPQEAKARGRGQPHRHPGWLRKILGISFVGTFCNNQHLRPAALVINAFSLGCWVVLAHELGHALNAAHDGDPQSELARSCRSSGHLMQSHFQDDGFRWSPCSIEALMVYFQQKHIWDCIYSQKRLHLNIGQQQQVAVSFKSINFALKETRLRSPADSLGSGGLEQQCEAALGPTAHVVGYGPASSRSDEAEGNNTADEASLAVTTDSCSNLICELGHEVDQLVEVNVGTPLSGSKCYRSTEPIFRRSVAVVRANAMDPRPIGLLGARGSRQAPVYGECWQQECVY